MFSLGYGTAIDILVTGTGPALAVVAFWAAIATLALRRARVGVRGAYPIAAGAALSVLGGLTNAVWSWVNYFNLLKPTIDQQSVEHPAFVMMSLATFVSYFVSPPLILWGLWQTWRRDVPAGEAQADETR